MLEQRGGQHLRPSELGGGKEGQPGSRFGLFLQVSWEPLENDTRSCSPGCATEQVRPSWVSGISSERWDSSDACVRDSRSSTAGGAQWGQGSELGLGFAPKPSPPAEGTGCGTDAETPVLGPASHSWHELNRQTAFEACCHVAPLAKCSCYCCCCFDCHYFQGADLGPRGGRGGFCGVLGKMCCLRPRSL